MSSRDIMGELRGLLAQRASLTRDAALCDLIAFSSRVELEQCGAWGYLEAASARGGLGASWDDGAWYDVRAGRMWGMAKQSAVSLRGAYPPKTHVLEQVVANTHETPCVSLDLGYLGESLHEVLLEFLARGDLSRLVWLDLSGSRVVPGVVELLGMYDLPSLKSLELRGHDVQDLHEVAWVGQLVHLGVGGCRVDDAWMKRHVRTELMPSLRSLDLDETQVAGAVWTQLGEQHGYEEMYALKMRGTWMNAQELGVCRWLPCLDSIDTFSCDVQGDLEGVPYDECMALLVDGLTHVRDLEVRLEGVAADVHHDVLAQLARTMWFCGLCGLGLDGASFGSASLQSLGVTSEDRKDETLLRRLALRNVDIPGEDDDDGWIASLEKGFALEALTNWSRLVRVRELEIESRSRKRYSEDPGWLLSLVQSFKTLEWVRLRHLGYAEISRWFYMWSTSKSVVGLREFELHGCDLRSVHFELLREKALAGPARWTFDGFTIEERCLVLEHLSDCLDASSSMWPWLGTIDLSSARDYIDDTDVGDDYFW